MVRQIIIPTGNYYTLRIPYSMGGKKISVIYWEKEAAGKNYPNAETDAKKELDEFYGNMNLDVSNFTISRE